MFWYKVGILTAASLPPSLVWLVFSRPFIEYFSAFFLRCYFFTVYIFTLYILYSKMCTFRIYFLALAFIFSLLERSCIIVSNGLCKWGLRWVWILQEKMAIWITRTMCSWILILFGSVITCYSWRVYQNLAFKKNIVYVLNCRQHARRYCCSLKIRSHTFHFYKWVVWPVHAWWTITH